MSPFWIRSTPMAWLLIKLNVVLTSHSAMEFGGHYDDDKGENKATGALLSRDLKIRCKAHLAISRNDTITKSDVCHTYDKQPNHLDAHVVNIRDEMRAVLEEQAFKKRSAPPSRVWTQIKDSFVTEYGELSGL